MGTRRLKAFIRMVDMGSLTRAADALGIAQPALSQQVAALEAEFGHSSCCAAARGWNRRRPAVRSIGMPKSY